MSFPFYILRHRPTGKLMPQYKGAGYTWWKPDAEQTKIPRLFTKKQYAELAKRRWEARKLRSKDELEIVEVLLSLLS